MLHQRQPSILSACLNALTCRSVLSGIVILITLVLFPFHNTFPLPFSNRIVKDATLAASDPTLAPHTIHWFVMNGGWAQVARYVSSASDDDHGWDAYIGATQEFFRIGNRFSFGSFLNTFAVMKPKKNFVNFNPQAIFWALGFPFQYRGTAGIVSWSVQHDCKHNVDLNRQSAQALTDLIVRKQLTIVDDKAFDVLEHLAFRNLIYDSIRVTYTVNPICLWKKPLSASSGNKDAGPEKNLRPGYQKPNGNLSSVLYLFAANNFFIHVDDLFKNSSLDKEVILNNTEIQALWEIVNIKNTRIVYLFTNLSLAIYGFGTYSMVDYIPIQDWIPPETARFDYTIEIGYTHKRYRGLFSHFIMFQHLYDTGIPLIRSTGRNSNLLSIGTRFQPNF